MSATTLSSPDLPTPSASGLPLLRQDLRLFRGGAGSDGSPTWRIHDPVRNRFFEIGWLEFELLSRWGGARDPAGLLEAVARGTTLRPGPAELEGLVEFLAEHQLLQPADPVQRNVLRARWLAGEHAWWQWLIHHYLFFRIPLVRPDSWLARTLPLVQPFMTRRFGVLVLLIGLLDAYLVAREWQAVSSTFSYFFSAQGLLGYAVAATVAKILHELGHGFVARAHGVRVPTMGVAFLVMWPVLYTDTGESWKLADRRARFRIAGAGIATELVLAVFATFFWMITPDGLVRSGLYLLATTSWVLTLAVNASPFMRFDGYFLLSDALDFPNLHERSFALARRALRRVFFGIDDPEPDPEPALSAWARRALVAFAFATWVYRFLLFIGIALLVYHLFFKALGVVLMVVEIAWFIARPIWKELREVAQSRASIGFRPVPWLGLLLLLCAGYVLIPFAGYALAPAVLRASAEQAVYAPIAARLDRIEVQSGQTVAEGDVLARLSAPELEQRRFRAQMQARAVAVELGRTSANAQQRDRSLVLQQSLAEALAEEQAAAAEIARLVLRAGHAGVVRDLAVEFVPGRWVHPRDLAMRVVSPTVLVEAYVSEAQLPSVHGGARMRFYPERNDLSTLVGTVMEVDPSAVRVLPHAILGSPNGGPIAAVANERGELVPHEAVYRVRIALDAGAPATNQIVRGVLRIDTRWRDHLKNVLARALAVLIRESGF